MQKAIKYFRIFCMGYLIFFLCAFALVFVVEIYGSSFCDISFKNGVHCEYKVLTWFMSVIYYGVLIIFFAPAGLIYPFTSQDSFSYKLMTAIPSLGVCVFLIGPMFYGAWSWGKFIISKIRKS